MKYQLHQLTSPLREKLEVSLEGKSAPGERQLQARRNQAIELTPEKLAAGLSAPTPILDLAAAGTAPGTVTRIYGSTGSGRFGLPVAGGYDLDGDGFVDAGFASITASPLGRSGAGEIALVFGDGTIGGTVDTAGFHANVLKIAGAQNYEVAGTEIWIDDVTGDGLGDLLIGRQNYTPEAGREGAGALTIIVGSPQLRAEAALLQYLDLGAPPASLTLTTFVGAAAYDRLGIWMRTGDVTGDGIADIVVGADEVDSAGESNRGAAYVIRGGAHLATSQIVDLADFGSTALEGHLARINPPAGSAGYHFAATNQIADLDGNGRAEVLTAAALNRASASIRLPGAPAGTGQPIGGSSRGTLYIAWDDNFPDELWVPGYEFDISQSPGGRTIIQGASFNQAFGEEILGGLDFSGDGKAELFVGDLVADGINGNNSGVGHVFYDAGSLKGQQFSLTAPPPTVDFSVIQGPRPGVIGADTATQGDFDGDGIGDLAFANPHDSPQGRTSAGTIHVLYGQAGNWPATIDLSPTGLPTADVMRILEIQGARGTVSGDMGDTLAYSLAAGDIDGDGRTDIIVNEMVGNGLAPGTIDVGNLLLIGGAALLPPRAMIQVTLPDGELADGMDDIRFGTPLSTFRDGATDSDLVRPNFPDTFQFIDIANTAGLGGEVLHVSSIDIDGNATGVSVALPEDGLFINPGQTERVLLSYAPQVAGESFNLNQGLVINSNAANDPTLALQLAGQSTFNSDITYDGSVNLGELAPLNLNFGSMAGDTNFDPTADINGDGFINLGDLALLNLEFGSSLT